MGLSATFNRLSKSFKGINLFSAGFTRLVVEKVNFPAQQNIIPTFFASFFKLLFFIKNFRLAYHISDIRLQISDTLSLIIEKKILSI